MTDFAEISHSTNEDKIEDFVNTVIEADCLRVLPRIPSHSVDMILCDLPYGTTQNKWDSVINLNRLWTQYMRIIKKNGVIVLTSQGIFTAKLILSNENLVNSVNTPYSLIAA